MAKKIKLRNITTIGLLDYVVDDIDSGGVGGWLRIYSGTLPVSPETATNGSLLAQFRLPYPCFKDSSYDSGDQDIVARSYNVDGTSVILSGVASYYRVSNSNDTAIMDGTVGTIAGQFDLVLNSVNLAQDGSITLGSWTVKAPRFSGD